MSAAGWIRWLLAAAMLAVVLYHLGRLVRGRCRAGTDLDVAHATMGTTMASMLIGAPWLSADEVLPVVFAGAACWFAGRAVRGFVLVGRGAIASPAQAGVGCAAMVVMLAGSVGASSAGSMDGPMAGMTMPAAADRSVGIALIVGTVALAGWTVGRWWQQHRTTPAAGLALGCQLAMNVTTVTMLAVR